jgi:hypothetical protein
MVTIELWFAESREFEGAFAVQPERRSSPEKNATYDHMEALVFAGEREAQAWCEANPLPPFVPSLWQFDTGAVH